MPETTVLIIGDTPDTTDLVRLVLDARVPGSQQVLVSTAVDFADAMAGAAVDLVIVDPMVGWSEPGPLLDCVHRHQSKPPIIVFSPESDTTATLAGQVGAAYVARNNSGVLALSRSVSQALGLVVPEAKPVTPPAVLSTQVPEGESVTSSLEALALTAHDLKEPVRSVINHLSVLRHRHSESLDEEAAELVESAELAAQRMLETVSRTLQSPAGGETGGLPEEGPSDCDAILRTTLENLSDQVERTGATFTNDPLPVVDMQPTQLGQVFQNLISNALKFRGHKKVHVRIWLEEADDKYTIHVSDNGIGMDAEDAERVFGMFERAHDPRLYPGSGIGLAICKKAVESAGGSIWLESHLGRGTTVSFSLPRSEPSASRPKKGKTTGRSASKDA